MTLAPGTVFAGFTIERTLGIGGMGTVYLARHPRLPRVEALKLLRPEWSDDPDFSERFAREADIVARLDHPNIVAVHDRGTEDGQLWISMPFIDGVDAEQALADNRGPLPIQRAIRIVAQVGAALDFAHRNGMWHRDVKPANILLAQGHDDEPERVWLTDFGIAKAADEGRGLTRTGNVIATFDYAAPEQIEGRVVDHRVDIYALGGVLHKLLTGLVPYPGSTMAASLYGHLNRPPPRPTERAPWLPPGLDEVLSRAMAKKPEDRYPSCRSFVAAVQAARDTLPAPPPLPYSFSVRRAEPGSGRAMVLGPLDTNDLPASDRDDLVGLVRQSRLFDLPARLPGPDPGRSDTSNEPRPDEITIAVQAGARTATVSYLAAQTRPEELDQLLHRLESRMPWQPAGAGATQPPDRPRAPATEYVPRPDAFPPYFPPPTPPLTPPPPTQPPPIHSPPRATDPPDSFAPVPAVRPHRGGRLVAAIATALLVIAAGVTAVILTNDDDRGPTGGGTPTAGTGSEDATGSSETTQPPSSSALGLPSGPPLPSTVLIAPHETAGNVDLYTVDSATGATQARLTTEAARDTQPLISPDRTSVVYLSRAEEVSLLWVVASDGSGARPLFETTPAGCDQVRGRAAWNSADPTMLAVVCLDANGPVTLQLLTPWGGRIRTLETGLASVGGPSFSPDGSGLVYWGNADPTATDGSLFRLQTDDSAAPVQLTDPAEVGPADSPAWSPDGTRIAFHVVLDAASTPPNTEIVVMEADGSNPVQLAAANGMDQDPTWSPDGSMIAFKSDRPDGTGERVQRLWLMNADGSGARLLSSEAVRDGFDAAW